MLSSYIARCKLRSIGLNVYYVIEKETNVGINYYDTINSYRWWEENEYTKTFDSRKEAEEIIEKRKRSWEINCKRAGYRVEFIEARAVPRIGKIVKDTEGNGRFPFRDMFIKSNEHDYLLKLFI